MGKKSKPSSSMAVTTRKEFSRHFPDRQPSSKPSLASYISTIRVDRFHNSKRNKLTYKVNSQKHFAIVLILEF